jgi:dTDP-4-amino-4,6-dideoxygalactose transaminase
MPKIVALAAQYGAQVIEDCAQSHGALIADRKAGAWGALAAFSFYPTKNLGALGDGGAVYTQNEALAQRVRLLRQYGWKNRYVSDIPGRNSRLDELQAAILRVKLQYLDEENNARRLLAAAYLRQLKGTSLQLPSVAPEVEPVYHQFTVRTPMREALRAYLHDRNIVAGVLYPTPIYRQPAYANASVALPETERACAEVLCLPCHPGLTATDVDHVCSEILRWTPPT